MREEGLSDHSDSHTPKATEALLPVDPQGVAPLWRVDEHSVTELEPSGPGGDGRAGNVRPVDAGLVIVIVLATFVGAVFQRIAGIGFALMLAPFMVVLLGPHGGVLFVNLLGAVAPALIIPQVRSRIDPVMFRRLVIPAVIATVPGVLLTLMMPTPPMSIAVGLMVMIGLGVAVVMRSSGRPRDSIGLQYATGAAAGLTSAVAGVGGPALTAYALISRWDLRTFAATIQPFFVVIGVVGFGMKLLLDPSQMPELPIWGWIGAMAAIIMGIWAGARLEPYLPDHVVRILVIVIGFIGAALALVQGILGLLP